jgi:hypothetical protein
MKHHLIVSSRHRSEPTRAEERRTLEGATRRLKHALLDARRVGAPQVPYADVADLLEVEEYGDGSER